MRLPLTLMTTEVKLSDNIINRRLSKNVDLSAILVINENGSNTTQDQETEYVKETTIETNKVTENEPKNNTIVVLELNTLENRVLQDESTGNHEQNTVCIPDNVSCK